MAPSMKVIKKAKVLAPRPLYPLSLLPLVFFLMLNANLLSAAEHREKAKPPPPRKPCQTKPLPQWTGQERWVWKQLCEGKIANFHEVEEYGGTLDPKASGWPKNRILRAAFLETILLHEPYQSALSQRGVRIRGARFTEPLDLSSFTIAHPVWLEQSRFEKDINLSHLRTAYRLSFRGSKVLGTLDMASVHVGDHLAMGTEAEFGEVVLTAAKIGGTLSTDGARFTGTLNMNGVQVEGNLYMGHGAEFGNVRLAFAKIQGDVSMEGAKFTGTKANPSVSLTLIFAEIGGYVELLGRSMPSIDLTGARIRGEFRLGSRTSPTPTTWQKDAKVTLRNAEVGVLQDIPEVKWPPNLELSGLRYAHLGAYTLDEPHGRTKDMTTHSISRYQDWLAKQAIYSPQPYEQLAGVLQKMGHKDEAEDILYAGKDRELRASSGFDWVGLFLQKIFIGYGYRLYYAIGWVLGFIVLGALVLKLSNEGPRHNMPYGLAYSFDMLLPLVKLREQHYGIELGGWARYYFYVHKIMGYVLASFLIAGLSGLTK